MNPNDDEGSSTIDEPDSEWWWTNPQGETDEYPAGSYSERERGLKRKMAVSKRARK